MANAAMTDVHPAIGSDVLEEPVEKCPDVEVRGAWARTAGWTGGEGDGAVCEAHETTVGESDPEDRGGEGGAGGVSMVIGLTLDVPGDGPNLWGAVLQHSSVAHGFFEQSAGDGGEGFDRDNEVGSGGPPR